MYDNAVGNMLLIVVGYIVAMKLVCEWCKPIKSRTALKGDNAVMAKLTIKYSMEEIGRAFRRM